MEDYLFVIWVISNVRVACLRLMLKEKQKKTIVSDIDTEYCVDDLVFDSKGGFYFTDFRGYSTNLKAVYIMLRQIINP